MIAPWKFEASLKNVNVFELVYLVQSSKFEACLARACRCDLALVFTISRLCGWKADSMCVYDIRYKRTVGYCTVDWSVLQTLVYY